MAVAELIPPPVTKPRTPKPLRGIALPRLAPPLPARTLVKDFRAASNELGISLMDWQDIVGRYLTALGPKDKWLYRRIAVAVARQNGKTEIIKPRVLMGLKMGRQQLHIAQDRLRPRRSTFEPLADFLDQPDRRELYGIRSIRYANGQEQILCDNGGSYTILAPTSGGARGGSFDDVYVDEAREFEDHVVEGIIRPTTTARPNAQIMYFSSAGHEGSVVLNEIRERRDDDPRLAYLEWSAAPERAMDDRQGWAEANPALGVTIDVETIEDDFRSMQPQEFETEHLCRWVISMKPAAVNLDAWAKSEAVLEQARRPMLAIRMDPSGTRASAVAAWRQADGTIACRVIADVTGDPIDTDRLGPDLRKQALKLGARSVSFSAWTDAELARHLPGAKSMTDRDFANASENFREVVESGRLRWQDAPQITADLPFTARKPHESGAWSAIKARDDVPITAALAAISAVYLASGPRAGTPRVL